MASKRFRFWSFLISILGTAVLGGVSNASAESLHQDSLTAMNNPVSYKSALDKESLDFSGSPLSLETGKPVHTDLDAGLMEAFAGLSQQKKKRTPYDPFRAARLLMTCA